MTWRDWRGILDRAFADVIRNHALTFSAGLSFYFMMGLFPALIALASVVGFLPIPNLFEAILGAMARVVPADSMGPVRQVVSDVISPNRGKLLSFGLLGAIWAVSGGFAGMMEALNVAYDVPETRPYWKTRLLSIWLSFQIGGLMLVALVMILLGPSFGGWAADRLHASRYFALAWPYLRWGITTLFVVLSVETVYFAGPNVCQRFRHTLIGALIAVSVWFGLSSLVGLYFATLAHLNRTYGALGGAIALMIWMQWTAFALLIGAEINSEILKLRGGGEVRLKYERRSKARTRQIDRELEWTA